MFQAADGVEGLKVLEQERDPSGDLDDYDAADGRQSR